MARQVYGTIRRVLNAGGDGTPWAGEIMLSTGEGVAYLELDHAPAATAGDDLLTFADLARERDGRLVARSARLSDAEKNGFRRLREGTRNARIDAGWQVLSGIVSAEKQGDVKLVMDGQSLSVVRPTVSFQPAREIIARHSSPQNETNPKFVLDPVIYASAARQAARKANAAPAGAGSDRSMLYFGNVEHCSYTQLVKISGPGMIPRYDVPAALAHEFMTAHEFAYQFDESRGKAGSPSSRERRRIESFADAFAVTELILAGRSLKDIDRIVACREAAIIGLAGARGRTKGSADAIVSLSGAAARAALNAAYTVVQNGGYVDAVALVQQATRISERHTISDKGMKELQSALARLSTDATQGEMSRWLKNLAAATTDEALSLTASSLAKRLKGFHTALDQKSPDVAEKVGSLHAESLRRHLAYSKENGLAAGANGLLASNEGRVWKIAPEGLLGRLARFVRKPADLASTIRGNIGAIPVTRRGMSPAVLKLPVLESSDPNPWTFSVADRLKQSATHAENAYKVIVETAARGGIPNDGHEERFAVSMRRLSSFVEAVVLRDPMKDGKAVRKKFDANPELEDFLRTSAAIGYRDATLPVSEGVRMQMQSLILAINPTADLPAMPAPPELVSGVEFGPNMFVSSDRD